MALRRRRCGGAGLLSSGGGARAIQDVGRDAVEAAVREALVPFTTIEDDARDGEGAGVVAMHNVFRYVVARRPHPPDPAPTPS